MPVSELLWHWAHINEAVIQQVRAALWKLFQLYEKILLGTVTVGSLVGTAYLSLAYFAVNLILGSQKAGNNDSSSQECTATLLDQPFGQFLIGAISLSYYLCCFVSILQSLHEKIPRKVKIQQISDSAKKWATLFGQADLSARGVVFLIVGIFLIVATVQPQASEVRGLSGALQILEQQPFET